MHGYAKDAFKNVIILEFQWWINEKWKSDAKKEMRNEFIRSEYEHNTQKTKFRKFLIKKMIFIYGTTNFYYGFRRKRKIELKKVSDGKTPSSNKKKEKWWWKDFPANVGNH